MPSTFRSDVTSGLVTIIDAFIAANPTLLRRSERARPPSVSGDLPVAWVDSRPEEVVHDSGTRLRTMQPSIVIVAELTDNVETVVRFDTLVDLFLDHLSASPSIVAGTIWDRLTIEDEPFEMTGTNGVTYRYYSTRFTFANVTIMEGRN